LAERKTANLTTRTARALRQRIEEAPLKAGEKLPTEKVLAAEFGVSRTVIREAIISLRADGLLEARHGVGYFVLKPPSADTETHKPFTLPQSSSRLDVLEFRMAVEIHAAGLAAARRSWAQEENIWSCAARFEAAWKNGEATEDADWAFHRSISEATNNHAFLEFFDQLGTFVLPRRALATSDKSNKIITRSYLEKSIAEHHAVCVAISHGDVAGARQAMQDHLGKSHLLYRGLAHGLTAANQESPADQEIPANPSAATA